MKRITTVKATLLFFLLCRFKKEEEEEKNSGGITQWVKVIIRINEVNLLLVCQCQYLELAGEGRKAE